VVAVGEVSGILSIVDSRYVVCLGSLDVSMLRCVQVFRRNGSMGGQLGCILQQILRVLVLPNLLPVKGIH
jgi:hypothetical protein